MLEYSTITTTTTTTTDCTNQTLLLSMLCNRQEMAQQDQCENFTFIWDSAYISSVKLTNKNTTHPMYLQNERQDRKKTIFILLIN